LDSTEGPSVEPVIEDTETMQIIHKALQNLSWKQNMAFVLMVIEEKDSKEAGDLMHCSAITARVHLGRAKETLRRVLTKKGIGYED